MTIRISEGFGLHLTLDGYGSPQNTLADKKLIKKTLLELPEILKMHRFIEPVVKWYSGLIPEDCGFSGFVMIAESHISIHTFTQKGFLTADVYSCKPFNTKKAIDYLKKNFAIKESEINIIKRGLKFPKTQLPRDSSQIGNFFPAN